MMAGGVAFVINGLLGDAKAKQIDPLALTVWVMVFAAIGLVATELAVEGVPAGLPSGPAAASVAASGIVGVAPAYLGYYLLLARAGAYLTSPYHLLVPPSRVTPDERRVGKRGVRACSSG